MPPKIQYKTQKQNGYEKYFRQPGEYCLFFYCSHFYTIQSGGDAFKSSKNAQVNC